MSTTVTSAVTSTTDTRAAVVGPASDAAKIFARLSSSRARARARHRPAVTAPPAATTNFLAGGA